MNRDAINKARMVYYGFFAAVFSFSLDEEKYAHAGRLLDLLLQSPVDDESAEALAGLEKFLTEGGYRALKEESDAVFFSPATTFVPMTASFHHENRDDGAKRLEMLGYVLESAYRRNAEAFKENEDHVEFVFLFMQRLIGDELAGNRASGALAEKVFRNILDGMLDDFSSNVSAHEKSVFYRDVAVLLRSFTAIERAFLDVGVRGGASAAQHSHEGSPRRGKKAPREIVKRNFDEFGSV